MPAGHHWPRARAINVLILPASAAAHKYAVHPSSRSLLRRSSCATARTRVTPLHHPPHLPQGPGSGQVQFCTAALLASLILDEGAMELIRQRREAPLLFEAYEALEGAR